MGVGEAEEAVDVGLFEGLGENRACEEGLGGSKGGNGWPVKGGTERGGEGEREA
jgi:hypothetical protein